MTQGGLSKLILDGLKNRLKNRLRRDPEETQQRLRRDSEESRKKLRKDKAVTQQ